MTVSNSLMKTTAYAPNGYFITGDIRDGENHKSTKWKTFKNIIKGSLRMKSSSKL